MEKSIDYSANTAHIMLLYEQLGRAAEKSELKNTLQYARNEYIYYRDVEESKKSPWENN